METPCINRYYKPNNPEYDAVCIMRCYRHYDICSVVERNGCLYIKPIDSGHSLSCARSLLVNKYAAVVVEKGEGHLTSYYRLGKIPRGGAK